LKLAILSDIHGNIFALEAVLEKISQIGVDRIIFLGDFTGYYYHSKEVFDRLLELDATMILGNHEHMLFDCADGILDAEVLRQKYGSGHKLALKQFTDSELDNVRKLPDYHLETINGFSIGCFHGSPFDPNFYLYPNASTEILSKCDMGIDFIFVGHSHYPFIAKLGHGQLVNVGSVGQSRVTGGLASWCLVDINRGTLDLQSTYYDTLSLLRLVDQYDPDIDYLSTVLKRGVYEE
jgi:putative phosphoesterase